VSREHRRPVRDPDGGTAYILDRKDRIECSKGSALLKNYKIKKNSVTNRVVATCCNSAMFMSFDKGPFWVSAYRGRFRGDLPALQMRICTKFKPEDANLPNDLPSYRGYPLRFVAKLLASRATMLFVDELRLPASVAERRSDAFDYRLQSAKHYRVS
jgi:hypothetical protein